MSERSSSDQLPKTNRFEIRFTRMGPNHADNTARRQLVEDHELVLQHQAFAIPAPGAEPTGVQVGPIDLTAPAVAQVVALTLVWG